MNLSPETKNIQSKLAQYCRDGMEIELPGITPNRLHQYRRLVFNIVNDNLEGAFPIAFQYLNTGDWDKMVYEFFKQHNCQSYQVWRLPQEFFEFVVKGDYARLLNIPYLNDLLNFEWTEMEVYNMEDIRWPDYIKTGDFLNDTLLFNPEFRLLQLSYPVHTHKPEDAQYKEGVYYVLLYREKDSGKVQFTDLSVWYALLIEQIHKNKFTLTQLLDETPAIFGKVDVENLKHETIKFIQQMQQKGFVIGFKK